LRIHALHFTLTEPIKDRVYVAQVLSLFSSVAASGVMAIIFVLNVLVGFEKSTDPKLAIIGAIGCFLNVWRITASIKLRKLASVPNLSRSDASRYEARFAIPYIGFAATLGVFGWLIFRLPYPELHMLTICVAVGYCAGVATNCGLRLPLAISSILLAISPIIFASLMKGDDTYSTMAVVAAALIAGATRSMVVRYDESKVEIGTRISSVSMARRDALTSLPNRLALNEFFAGRLALSPPGTKLAVHYLDLDGFKPVNDKHGHAVGDQLLLAVACRLRQTIRRSDMVARLGGDEFAVVQLGLIDADEAHALSWRIREAIEQPYPIGNSNISISTSVGTIVSSDRSCTLDALLQLADMELYGVKRARQKLLNRTAF
jgi:diguanylate cyclase (GGDEF)-like protein